jgi:multidrug resistance efflux pump
MNRIIAGLALAGILGWAVYYNLRERAALTIGANPSPDNRALTPSAYAPAKPPNAPVTGRAADSDPIPRTLSVVGTVRADKQAAISARVSGRVVSVLVRAGQEVKSGQPLVRLDVGDIGAQVAGADAGVDAAQAQYAKALNGKRARMVELESQISQAESGLRTALAKQRQAELAVRLGDSTSASDNERAVAAVRQAEAGLRIADSGVAQAGDTLKRTQFLYSHGGVARVDLEGAQAQADIAKAQRDSAFAALEQARAAAKPAAETAPLRRQVSEADLELARSGVDQAREGVRNAHRAKAEALKIADSDIQAAHAQVNQARAGKRQAASQSGAAVLTTPFSGVVTDLAIHAGESAQPGQPLMSVVSTDSTYLEAAAPARYARQIRPGSQAVVRLDTAPDRALQGSILEVLPVSTDGRSVVVRIRFFGGERPLPGIGAKAEIDIEPAR